MKLTDLNIITLGRNGASSLDKNVGAWLSIHQALCDNVSDDEEIKWCVMMSENDKIDMPKRYSNSRTFFNVLALLDQRIIVLDCAFLSKSEFDVDVNGIQLSSVARVDISSELPYHKLEIVSTKTGGCIGISYRSYIHKFALHYIAAIRDAAKEARSADMSLVVELERLAALRESMHLSDEEYALAKKKILSRN